MTTKAPTIGSLLTKLSKARAKKAAADVTAKVCEEELNATKKEVLDMLQAQGMDKASGANLTVSVQQATVANVTDWEAFHAFIKKNNCFHLLQRRVSEPAWREMRELMLAKKKDVPGTEPFNKLSLSITTLK